MHFFTWYYKEYDRATKHLTLEEDMAYRRLIERYYEDEREIPKDTKALARKLRLGEESIKAVLEEFFEETETGWRHEKCEAVLDAYRTRQFIASQNGKKGGRPRSKAIVGSSKPNPNQQVSKTKPPLNLPFAETDKEGEKEGVEADFGQKDESDDSSETASGSGIKANANPTKTQPLANKKSLNKKQEHKNPPKPPVLVGFDEFWDAYPNHHSKVRAEKAWKALNPSPEVRQAIFDALAWQTVSERWTKNGGDYVPNAHTYLDNARWTDEPPSGVVPGQAGRAGKPGFDPALRPPDLLGDFPVPPVPGKGLASVAAPVLLPDPNTEAAEAAAAGTPVYPKGTGDPRVIRFDGLLSGIYILDADQLILSQPAAGSGAAGSDDVATAIISNVLARSGAVAHAAYDEVPSRVRVMALNYSLDNATPLTNLVKQPLTREELERLDFVSTIEEDMPPATTPIGPSAEQKSVRLIAGGAWL